MEGFEVTIRWERRRAPPIVLGERVLTPEAWVLHGRLPGVGFVWNRPVAVIVERDGHQERLPIVDMTRWIEVGVWVVTALTMLATMRTLLHRR